MFSQLLNSFNNCQKSRAQTELENQQLTLENERQGNEIRRQTEINERTEESLLQQRKKGADLEEGVRSLQLEVNKQINGKVDQFHRLKKLEMEASSAQGDIQRENKEFAGKVHMECEKYHKKRTPMMAELLKSMGGLKKPENKDVQSVDKENMSNKM